MPSYPLRPTFPIDVRPGNGIAVTRVGTGFRFDSTGSGGGGTPTPPGPSRNQFLTALESAYPGAARLIEAAVPSDPAEPVHRAYLGTGAVTAAGALAQFAKTVLTLTDAQLAAAIAAALLIVE